MLGFFCFENQTTFLSADLSSGNNDSMIEVVIWTAPISVNCLFMSLLLNLWRGILTCVFCDKEIWTKGSLKYV